MTDTVSQDQIACVSASGTSALSSRAGDRTADNGLGRAFRVIVSEHLDFLFPDVAALEDAFKATLMTSSSLRTNDCRPLALLADDAFGLLMSFGVMLEAHGYEVVSTGSEEEAILELASARKFDLVVSEGVATGSARAAFIDQVQALRPKIQTIFLSDFGKSLTQTATIIALHNTPQWRSRHGSRADIVAA